MQVNIFSIVAVLSMSCTGISGRAINVSECVHTNNLQNHFDSLNKGFNLTQYFMHSSSDNTDVEVKWINFAYESAHGPGGTECPTQLPHGDYPLMMRSTCPWYIKLHVDPKRFPSTLPKAVPRCANCVGSNGTLLCQPIRQTIHVLKQTHYCGDGLYKYEQATEELEIAFVCAIQREVVNSNMRSSSEGSTPGSNPGEPPAL